MAGLSLSSDALVQVHTRGYQFWLSCLTRRKRPTGVIANMSKYIQQAASSYCLAWQVLTVVYFSSDPAGSAAYSEVWLLPCVVAE
jgi:hypothetical protein